MVERRDRERDHAGHELPQPERRATAGKRPRWRSLTASSTISAPPLPGPNVIGLDTLWVSDGTTAGTMPIAGRPGGRERLDPGGGRRQALLLGGTRSTSTTSSGSPTARPPGPGWSRMWARTSATINRLVAAGPNLYIFTTNPAPAPRRSRASTSRTGPPREPC